MPEPVKPNTTPVGKLWNVPPLTGKMVERPEVLDNLRYLLLTSQSEQPGVLVASAIQGQGGVGKTVLAQLLAHEDEVRAHFLDGLYWIALGQEPDLPACLSALILQLDPTYKLSTLLAASAHLQALLAEKQALFILDDAWNTDHLQPFLVGGMYCRYLITTRRLAIVEEIHAVAASLDVMTPPQALQLLENRLNRPLADHEREQALELAQAVGFLPLALELAAARVQEGSTNWNALTQALHQEMAGLEALEGSHRAQFAPHVCVVYEQTGWPLSGRESVWQCSPLKRGNRFGEEGPICVRSRLSSSLRPTERTVQE